MPLPHALDQDQFANAGVLAGVNAAIRLPQAEFTPRRLAAEIAALAGAPKRLAAMAAAAKFLGRLDAADRLADLVLKVARGTSRESGRVCVISSYLQRSGVYVFLVAFACVYYLINAPLLLSHWDLGWHLAAGDLIRDQRAVPFHDPWSFTSAGRQWFNLSWLWDVFASVVFQHADFIGLVLLTVACGAVIAVYLGSVCLSAGASTISACAAVLFACLFYPAFSALYPNVYLAVSPNVSTMLFSVVFYGECLRRRRLLFWLPAMMVLWANLHGGFLLGLILIGIFFGVALVKRDWANLKIYGFVGLGCFAATFINPLGWHIYEGLASVLGNFSQAYITEWWPYYRNIALPASIPGTLYILLFITLEVRYGGAGCAVEARLDLLAVSISGALSVQVHVVLLSVLGGAAGPSIRSGVAQPAG